MVHSIINIKRAVLNIMSKAAPKKHEYGFSRTRVEFWIDRVKVLCHELDIFIVSGLNFLKFIFLQSFLYMIWKLHSICTQSFQVVGSKFSEMKF